MLGSHAEGCLVRLETTQWTHDNTLVYDELGWEQVALSLLRQDYETVQEETMSFVTSGLRRGLRCGKTHTH